MCANVTRNEKGGYTLTFNNIPLNFHYLYNLVKFAKQMHFQLVHHHIHH